MRFFVTFWIGVVLGLAGIYATSSIYFIFLGPIGLPIFGGLLYFLWLGSEHDAASEHALTMRQLTGRALGVVLALFLGVPIGILFAMLLAAGG